MNRYKLVISYDGTDYHGWQSQPNRPSIMHALQKSFALVFKKKISLFGASRTDAGVHALGQVATIATDLTLDPSKLQSVWNNALPHDIVIRSVVHDNAFNPFVHVDKKIYYYHLFLKRPLSFTHRFGTYFPRKLDIDKLRKSLQCFVGTHDFRSFATGNEREDTVRVLTEASIFRLNRFDCYRIHISGQRFLKYMVRRIVGACLKVASTDLPVDSLRDALAQKNAQQQFPTAPAKGLMLYKVIYKKRLNDE